MEKPNKSNLLPHRRLESMDVKKSSSSLNMSTSSLRSINEDRESTVPVGKRSTTIVRFAPTPAPPPSSSAAVATRRSALLVSQQAPKTRPATARPASASGPKARSSPAGRLPESGPKAMRRSWGWTAGGVGGKEMENGDVSAARSKATTTTQVRSCSVPRRMPTEEKPLQKRESKIKITSRTKATSNPSPKPDVLHTPSTQRSSNIASKPNEKAPSGVSLNNMVKVSPPRRTTAAMMGASWESLPSDLQNLGSAIMSYRDAAEMAAVEALQEASAAEIVLRCLSAFADLAASAANQSPQQTVDEFLALQTVLTRSTAVLGDQQQGGQAGDWLHAAVTADLAPFSLYTAQSSPSKSSSASPAVPPPAAPRGEPAAEATWLETAARELGEEMLAWFVGYVERLLDADVAGTLGQLKRVNDWLDAVGMRSEAAERLRKKIFGYLLDHVESAVVALNGGVAPNRRK